MRTMYYISHLIFSVCFYLHGLEHASALGIYVSVRQMIDATEEPMRQRRWSGEVCAHCSAHHHINSFGEIPFPKHSSDFRAVFSPLLWLLLLLPKSIRFRLQFRCRWLDGSFAQQRLFGSVDSILARIPCSGHMQRCYSPSANS